MKKIFYLLILISILSISSLAEGMSIFNTTSGIVITESSYIKVALVNQDPSSAVPGEYVNLLFKVENRGTNDAKDVSLELLPEYPFSLDPGLNAVQELGTVKGLQSGDNAFLVRYKVKVDKDAVDGGNEIKLKYLEGDSSVTIKFNISVSNPQTDFDVIIQDSTSTLSTQTGTSTTPSTTLTIANIGANDAQSVIVRIPEQENFRTAGSSASVIGNLNGGDYTIITFQLNSMNNASIVRERNLTVEISYTDTLGIRRTVQKNVPLALGSTITGNFIRSNQSQNIISNSILYIGIGAAGIIVIVVLIKIKTRKKK